MHDIEPDFLLPLQEITQQLRVQHIVQAGRHHCDQQGVLSRWYSCFSQPGCSSHRPLPYFLLSVYLSQQPGLAK